METLQEEGTSASQETMRIRHFLSVALVAAALSVSGAAMADDPQSLIQTEQGQVQTLLRQPSSADRNAKINAILAQLVDYDQLTQACFGSHWEDLNGDQRGEVRDLLKKIVERTWRRNLIKTLNYDVHYNGTQAGESDGQQVVKTEAFPKDNSHEPPTRVDYTMIDNGSGWHVVDLVTEESSLVANYGSQIDRMLREHDYAYLVRKLKERANASNG
jgi:phospholipid transport system substrate-binding protein